IGVTTVTHPPNHAVTLARIPPHHPEHLGTVGDQTLGEPRADEAIDGGDQRARHIRTVLPVRAAEYTASTISIARRPSSPLPIGCLPLAIARTNSSHSPFHEPSPPRNSVVRRANGPVGSWSATCSFSTP